MTIFTKEKYPLNSAGNKMITEVPVAKKGELIKNIMSRLRKESKNLKAIDYIYVVDRDEKLIGVASLREIFVQPPTAKIEKVMQASLITVSPETDQEKVADIALKHNIRAVPVVKKRKLLGVVPAVRIFSILNRTLQEDILHFAGIHKSHLEYENTLAIPLLRTMVHRLPWLIIGLFGIMIAAGYINLFETTLQKYILLAFFIPAIVYVSDALGTQHQTLFVRDLAILGKKLDLKLYFLKQMLTSFLIAIIISSVVYLMVSFFWKQYSVAIVVSLSMFIALIVTSFNALGITLLIRKLGQDPALGSGPFATIVSDITSVVIYFLVAFLILGG